MKDEFYILIIKGEDKMYYGSNELNMYYDEELDKVLVYNDDMIGNGIVFEVMNRVYIEERQSETRLSVLFINTVEGFELDAACYSVYFGEYLSPIQERRIILDLFDMYKEHGKRFITILEDDAMYVQKQTSSMQSNPKNGKEIYEFIKRNFTILKKGA